MKPSRKCVDLVKQFEGLKLKSYLCPASKWTIGYGTTRWADGKPVQECQSCTLKQAEDLLINDLNLISARLPNLKVNQNQLDAIVSFVYNLGMGNFIKSTLFKYVRENPDDARIAGEFMKWTKARVNGELKTLKGLVKRRKAESNLYYDKN